MLSSYISTEEIDKNTSMAKKRVIHTNNGCIIAWAQELQADLNCVETDN